MPRWFTPLLIVAVVGLALSVSAALMLRARQAEQAAEARRLAQEQSHVSTNAQLDVRRASLEQLLRPIPEPLGELRVPEFSLVDQDGIPADQSIFDGQVTVLSFVFTHCVLVCPMLTGRMYEQYENLAGTNVRFVSISVDPANDTPARLREYAAAFGVDHSRWRFLTGDAETIRRIASESLKFDVSDDPDDSNRITLPSGQTMANIRHPDRMILVGPDRRLIGLYSPNFEDDRAALTARLKAIAGKDRG
ncbi:MAG: SCO family protein [Phycisphaeraceae bacterium]|nr:SCO family protein [Phycisphaeraceae bacterium]